jgi:hypothetical protein
VQNAGAVPRMKKTAVMFIYRLFMGGRGLFFGFWNEEDGLFMGGEH